MNSQFFYRTVGFLSFSLTKTIPQTNNTSSFTAVEIGLQS